MTGDIGEEQKQEIGERKGGGQDMADKTEFLLGRLSARRSHGISFHLFLYCI